GLAIGAPVQSSGVKIGHVEKIAFVRHNYEYPLDQVGYSKYNDWVRVLCSVTAENLPEALEETRDDRIEKMVIKGLRLRLSSNILTGQAIVEAEYLQPERFPVPEFPWKPEYLYIPSAPSTLSTLKDSVDKILFKLESIETHKIAENLNDVILSVNEAIKDADVSGVRTRAEDLLDNANQAIADADIAKLSQEVQGLFAEARQTNQDLKKLLENPTPDEELANIAELVDQLDLTMNRIDQLIRTQSPQLVEMIENFKQISDNLNTLVENLRENPSDLIFSQPPKKKGGE
ncbi:MAG: MlaD/PqiB family protein, partial [Planctomycetota bacterium]